MKLAIAYHAGDLDQAERLEGRMRELGPYPGHSILVARDSSTDKKLFRDCGFDSWQEIAITNDVWKSWPASPNNAFRQIAVYIEYTKPEPWLLLEPDVALIRKGWLDEIAAAYKEALAQGKFFLGAFVPGFVGQGHNGQPVPVPDHMSGIAVYPGQLKTYAGKATVALESPWDIEGADQILPLAQFTKLMQHNWRRPSFASWEELAAELDPAAVIYHSDKAGSVVKLLRERENLGSGVEVTDTQTAVAPLAGPERAHAAADLSRRGSGRSAPPAQIPSPKSDPEGGAESVAERRANIRSLCQSLKVHCGRGSAVIVRQELHNAGVLKVPGYRKRRAK